MPSPLPTTTLQVHINKAAMAAFDDPLRIKGVQAKQVHDLTMGVDGVKVGRKGRLALYKSMHCFVLAAATLAEGHAEEGRRQKAGADDLTAALELLGYHNIASRVRTVAEQDKIKDQEDAAKAAKKKSAAKPAKKKSAKPAKKGAKK